MTETFDKLVEAFFMLIFRLKLDAARAYVSTGHCISSVFCIRPFGSYEPKDTAISKHHFAKPIRIFKDLKQQQTAQSWAKQ